jgi:hypothetical protein
MCARVWGAQWFCWEESESEQVLECVSGKLLFLRRSCLLDFGLFFFEG